MGNSTTKKRFASQWDEIHETEGQIFLEPSETIPDQSMTIPEIIAKFTRSGMVPASIRNNDEGGNIAADPDADPLDDFHEIMAAAEAAKRAVSDKPDPDPEPEPSSAPASAGA